MVIKKPKIEVFAEKRMKNMLNIVIKHENIHTMIRFSEHQTEKFVKNR